MAITWRRRAGIAVAIAALGLVSCRSIILRHFEPKFLTTGPNGPETPASFGITFERVKISSGARTLDAFLVLAPASCQPKVAVLIFHGVMETISEWAKAQRFLHDQCISSLAFDYSGHGDSSRPGTIRNLNQDSTAAYSWFASRFSSANNDTRLCVLGHSMGNGTMLAALPSFHPRPPCVVVANAFTSLRNEGKQSLHGPMRLLVYAMPDEWNNVKNVKLNHVPLLLIHSDTDSVIPVVMGREVFQAALEPKQIVILHGFKHNALYRTPAEDWWSAPLQFLRSAKTLPAVSTPAEAQQ